MTTTHTFQIGQSYSARSASDHNTIYRWVVTKRTAKFITVETKWGDIARVGVQVWDGVERAEPFGRYSFSPTIFANRPDSI